MSLRNKQSYPYATHHVLTRSNHYLIKVIIKLLEYGSKGRRLPPSIIELIQSTEQEQINYVYVLPA